MKENKTEKSNREGIVGENSVCVCVGGVCVRTHALLFSAAAKNLYCFVILNRVESKASQNSWQVSKPVEEVRK